jgi:hypothetical protein
MKQDHPHIKPLFIKKARLVFYFAAIFIFGMSNPAAAQKTAGLEELLQEFFIGQTVYSQKKNEIQFTSKPAYWNKKGLEMISLPLQFEYGFTNRFQIELNLPYYFLRPKPGSAINGMGNLEVGFLYNILKGNKPFALSLALDIGLPTAKKEKDIDEAELEWEPSIIIARQIGRAQVHGSLAAEITNSESAFNYNLAAVFPFGDWRATLELNGKINDEKIIYLTPGLIWKGVDDFEFGAGVSKSRAAWGVILMATYEFSLPTSKKLRR